MKSTDKDKDDVMIGKRIRRVRNQAGFSQDKLAELTGITKTQISAYENGHRSIGVENLSKIAKTTNTTMDDIYFGRISERPITLAKNKGELIVNCISALYDEGVVSIINTKKRSSHLFEDFEEQFKLTNYTDIIEDLIRKLKSFEADKGDYPNPDSVKEQILQASVNKINTRIESKKK